MTLRFLGLVVLGLTMIFGHVLWADESTADVESSQAQEEMLRDSEAARTVAREKKEELQKEREQVAQLRAHNAEVRAQVKADRIKTEAELKAIEKEFRALKREESKLQVELEKHNQDVLYFERSVKVAQEKLSTQHDRGVTLVGLKNTKLQRVETLTRQKASLLAELSVSQKMLNQAQAEFDESRAQEQAAQKNLTATRVNVAQTKLATEAKINLLKAEYKRNHEQTVAIAAQIEALNATSARLSEEARVGEGEVARSTASLGQSQQRLKVAQAQLPPMKLRRDCKIHSGPQVNSSVLGVQPSGTSVALVQQQEGWIGFSSKSTQGKLGFVNKACF